MTSKNLIVYCPGYTGLPWGWTNPLLKRLKRDGFSTLNISYPIFGRGDISTQAETTAQIVQALQNQFDTITWIGHSMGGLVARKALCKYPELGDYLITLGTPHKGIQTPFKQFWRVGGHSVGQMLTDSLFLTYCGEPTVHTLAVTGDWDLLVRDGSWESDKDFVQNISIPRTTHLGLIANHRTYGEIYSWLVYEQLDVLDPAPEKSSYSIEEAFRNF